MDNILITPEYLQEEYQKLEKAKAEFYEEREKSGIEYKLFVGSIDISTSDEELHSYFSPYGPIKQCWILRRDGVSKKSGFVKFYYKHSADNAIEGLNGKFIDKSQKSSLVVRYANAKVNPPATIQHAFQSTPGDYIMSPNSSEGMQLDSTSNQSMISANVIRSTSTRGPPGANLYVNHLKSEVSEDDLRNLFSTLGNVISTRVCPGRYGFVSYDNPLSAQRAITHLNNTPNLASDGKVLEVSIKKDKELLSVETNPALGPSQHLTNSNHPPMNHHMMSHHMVNSHINMNASANHTTNNPTMSINPYY